jgi:hypothetical protein
MNIHVQSYTFCHNFSHKKILTLKSIWHFQKRASQRNEMKISALQQQTLYFVSKEHHHHHKVNPTTTQMNS